MEQYHLIWLENHPDYNEEWLRTALKAGFDIHHIDGDHYNNDFNNLVLIENCDHQKLHGRKLRLFGNRGNWIFDKIEKANLGKTAYGMRQSGWKWKEIGQKLGYKNPQGYAINVAKAYASYHNKAWPIPHIEDCGCTNCKSNKSFSCHVMGV